MLKEPPGSGNLNGFRNRVKRFFKSEVDSTGAGWALMLYCFLSGCKQYQPIVTPSWNFGLCPFGRQGLHVSPFQRAPSGPPPYLLNTNLSIG